MEVDDYNHPRLRGDTQREATREAPAQAELRPTKPGFARRLATTPTPTHRAIRRLRLSNSTSIPEALATGNLDLRTHCRVIRIGTDENGRVTGAEYIDPQGRRRFQKARTVILSAYTFESLRLLFLSGDSKHPDGLGNNRGQLGKHFMTKMFAHVDGFFPETIFNRHTGPAAQGLVLDDFFAPGFDSFKLGFIGGATLGAEQQFLPI